MRPLYPGDDSALFALERQMNEMANLATRADEMASLCARVNEMASVAARANQLSSLCAQPIEMPGLKAWENEMSSLRARVEEAMSVSHLEIGHIRAATEIREMQDNLSSKLTEASAAIAGIAHGNALDSFAEQIRLSSTLGGFDDRLGDLETVAAKASLSLATLPNLGQDLAKELEALARQANWMREVREDWARLEAQWNEPMQFQCAQGALLDQLAGRVQSSISRDYLSELASLQVSLGDSATDSFSGGFEALVASALPTTFGLAGAGLLPPGTGVLACTNEASLLTWNPPKKGRPHLKAGVWTRGPVRRPKQAVKAHTVRVHLRVRCWFCGGPLLDRTEQFHSAAVEIELPVEVVPFCPGCVEARETRPEYWAEVFQAIPSVERPRLIVLQGDGQRAGKPRGREILHLVPRGRPVERLESTDGD